MTTRALAAWLVLSAGGWPGPLLAGADADDYAEPLRRAPAQLSLTSSQEQAVGIRVEQPLALRSAPQIEAYGTVLDPVALANDMGRVETTRVAAAAAQAEATRLEHLYRDDAQVSLKASQAAQAQSAEASAQARAAALGFSLQWGPLASWSAGQRRALLEALTHGRQLLVRADVPAHPLGSTVDRHAVVVIDGVNVSARVLGPLPRTDGPAQTAGWLLQLERTPGALGPGARIEVRLQAAAASGLLVPAEALVYAEKGSYVYRRHRTSSAAGFHYEAVRVRPLSRVGSAWLVEGLAPDDQVVVQGAGVLWSLQGVGSFSAAEEEHD